MEADGLQSAHAVFRILQVLTLIPAWAMMAAIVSWYNSHTVGAPGEVLALFIITLLASVWAFCILIATQRAGNTAPSIALTDILAMAALIAAVVVTADTANYGCDSAPVSIRAVYVTSTGDVLTANGVQEGVVDGYRDDGDELWYDPGYCSLLKGAWGLAIANIIMFFITAVLAVVVYQQNQEPKDTVIVEERSPITREKYYAGDYPQRPRRAARGSQRSWASPRSQTFIA